jgi:putative membrane protein
MRGLMMVAACGALLTASALAQIGNPAGVEPGTPESAPGVPAPHQPNTQDRLFARLTAAGGRAEVEFGQFAEQKAGNPRVKEFARRMVQDHQKANEQLADLAKQANIALPGELDPDHKAVRAELEKLSGGAFDVAYMQGQVVDHQKTASLLQYEISFGQDADLQRFAAATLPAVLAHLQMAQNIVGALTGAGGPVAAQSSPSPRPPGNAGPPPR